MSVSAQNPSENIRVLQQTGLAVLLRNAWQHSPFYRDYYSSHGVRESDLAEITAADLPLLSKNTLMENFDLAVTDRRLKKSELEHWFERHPDPRDKFSDDFVVIHSSGSSGTGGIFVYDRKAWRVADVALARFLGGPENPRPGKIKAAFYIASHGHFAGVASARSLPQSLYDTLILSLLDSQKHVVDELNAFQPQRLHGYSSSLLELAELALRGKLQIRPERIFASGDKLTESMEATIRRAWDAPIHNIYAAGESKHIAIQTSGQDRMIVLDELNVLEILGDDNRPVAPGAEGRVVLTNLYNHALPILRYELEDYVISGTPEPESTCTTIRTITGRTYEALPIVLDNGEHDQINPHTLTGFRFPGVDKIQYVSKRLDDIEIVYVGADNAGAAIRNDFYRVLSSKGSAARTNFRIRRVDDIDKDPRTGKLHRVRIESTPAPHPPGRSAAITKTEKPEILYRLVKNTKAQYSLIPANDDLPQGWFDTGKLGSKADCAGMIKDLAPSVRSDDSDTTCIQAIFEDRVKQAPNHPALAFGERALTYDELNSRANRLTRCLRSLGVDRNKTVAVCLPRSLDMMIGILATIKAGGAWLPLDASQPEARQEAALHNARCGVMLTHTAFAPNISHARETIFLDKEWPSIAQLDGSDLENRSTPADLAYVMHTSGSTGQPKGVQITRANLSHYVRSMGEVFGIDDQDTYLHTANIAFSSSVRQLMVPLCRGAKVVIAATEDIQQPAALFATIKRQRVTILDVVPSYWRSCIDVLMKLHDRKRASLLDNQLRLILNTGEPLLPDLPEKWARQFDSRATVVNMFGQTETTGTVATYAIPAVAFGSVQGKTVPIGGPIPNTEIFLLDRQQQPVPVGSDGEIYVAGKGLGLGYLGRPDLNAEKFVPNPFSSIPGERLYRTGDLARFRFDGDMEFVSRVDDQVKIRGIRIELEEIRSVLSQHPGVRQTAVTASDRTGSARLTAYVAPKAENAVTRADLRTFLKRQLPDYMIPSTFVMLDALPLTPSGKINRQALPAPVDTTSENTYVAPRTQDEKILAAIWAEALGLPRVGIHDDFFDLGGHSLAVTQIISRIAERFNLDLPVRSLLEAPSVAAIAAVVKERQARETSAADLASVLAEVESLSEEDAQKLVSRESC